MAENLLQPIRSTTQIWVVKLRHYGMSALVSQTSFRRETKGSVAKYRLFSHATSTMVVHVEVSCFLRGSGVSLCRFENASKINENGTLQKYCSAKEILHEMAAPFRPQAQ